MFNQMKINIIVLIFLFVISFNNLAKASDIDTTKDVPINTSRERLNSQNQLLFEFDSRSYAYNLEFMGIPYVNGETWFGDNLRLLLHYKVGDDITYTGGLYAAMIYGENEFLDPIAPVLTFNYEPDKNFYLTIGSLDRRKHALIEPLYDDSTDLTWEIVTWAMLNGHKIIVLTPTNVSNFIVYSRPLDNGVEVYTANFKPLSFQTWFNWRAIEEAADGITVRPGDYDASAIALLDFKSSTGIVINGQWHYIHRYGVYNDRGVTQSDNALDAGISYTPSFMPNAKLSANLLFSNAVIDDLNLEHNGEGQELKLDYNLYNWQLFATYWNGNSFYAEDGNQMYQASRFTNIGFLRKVDITKGVNISFGLTIYFLNNTWTHSEWCYFNFDRLFKLL